MEAEVKKKVRATRKQKQVISLLSENVGMSTGKAMRLAGYSRRTSLQPHRLTKSLAFTALAERYLPSDKILEVATKGLEADKITRYKGVEYSDPDYYARHLYLQTALKIRGLAQQTDTPIGDINIQVVNYGDTKADTTPTIEAE